MPAPLPSSGPISIGNVNAERVGWASNRTTTMGQIAADMIANWDSHPNLNGSNPQSMSEFRSAEWSSGGGSS